MNHVIGSVLLGQRSSQFGWVVTAVVVLIGAPLFLRMPPWCDLTLYDVAARNVLQGGVHYRDVFDTNAPGFVWLLACIRISLSDSVEAARAADVFIVAATVTLLLGWVRRAGGTTSAMAWTAAGSALFYLFISEYSHCQRDVWMMLPVVAAVRLRLHRPRIATHWTGSAILEGFVFGVAAWLKPHSLIPAAAAWLASLSWVSHSSPKRIVLDFASNFLGGTIAFILGAAWIVATGAWPAFWEVFTFWNPGYLDLVTREFQYRWPMQFSYFPPWSWFQPFALVLAVAAIVRKQHNPYRRTLAALYLAWVVQGLLLQRMFDYVHVPETLLMLALLASFGIPAGFVGAMLIIVGVATHPLTDTRRLGRWTECWRGDVSPTEYRERRNALGFQIHCFNGIDWVQLGEVSDFLKRESLRDGELIAWHDTPHALYLTLGIRPSFRFMHVSTVTQIGRLQYERLREELHSAAPKARFVVADLERVFNTGLPGEREKMEQPGQRPGELLPPAFRANFPGVAAEFPFDQSPVFRSARGRGRYVVFRLDRPVTPECRIPSSLGEDLPIDD